MATLQELREMFSTKRVVKLQQEAAAKVAKKMPKAEVVAVDESTGTKYLALSIGEVLCYARLEMVEGSHDKYWEVAVVWTGSELQVARHYGRKADTKHLDENVGRWEIVKRGLGGNDLRGLSKAKSEARRLYHEKSGSRPGYKAVDSMAGMEL